MANKGTSTDLAPAAHVDDAAAAAFRLEPHRVKMMLDEPFFAAVLRGVNYERTEAIPTAGVLAKDGDAHKSLLERFKIDVLRRRACGCIIDR